MIPAAFRLGEQRKFRFGLVCLLVQKFENLRFSQEPNPDTRMYLARLGDNELS